MKFKIWSKPGKYHLKHDLENEDFISTAQDKNAAVAVLCDGVSTCENAKKGAEVASGSLCWFLMNYGLRLLDYSRDLVADYAVHHMLYDLEKYSKQSGVSVESLSSTAAGLFYDIKNDRVLGINLGDALIGGITEEGLAVFLKPQEGYNGCYVTTTKGAQKVTNVRMTDAKGYKAFFICSDGMWKHFHDNRGSASNEINDVSTLEAFVNRIKCGDNIDDWSLVVMANTGAGKDAI